MQPNQKKIDWTKPIEIALSNDEWIIAKFIAKLNTAKDPYITSYFRPSTHQEELYRCAEFSHFIRNKKVKKEGWINVYEDSVIPTGKPALIYRGVFTLERDALFYASVYDRFKRTIKIEWEE